MTREIAGSVVVVTGAGSGLGAATARRFVQEGAQVIVSDIDADAAQHVADELGTLAVVCDVTDEAQVAALIDGAVVRFGRIDTMIGNAGAIGARGSIAAIDHADWSRTVALLMDSVFFGMKHAARHMIGQGQGAILTTASNASVAALGPHCYAACKSAVLGLTRSVAAEMARHGVTVNAVAPGMIATGLTSALYGGEEATRRMSGEVSPLGRPMDPDDIAAAFLFLAGPGGRNMTGQTMVVDGGTTTVIRPSAHY